MINKIRHNFLLGLMLVTALVSIVPTSVFAAGESAYLTPASGSAQTGSSFTVSVDGYVGQSYFWWVPIGASSVQGSMSFSAQNLKVTSINTDGAAFPTGTPTFDNAAGTISFNSSSSGSYMNQNVHLFSITFQAANVGGASVSFGTVKYNINGAATTTGGSYTVTAPPAPAPTPPPVVTPKPTTKPVTTVKPSPVPVPTPSTAPTPEDTPAPTNESDGGLKIENVKVTATRDENSITWSLNNAAARPTVSYGTNKNLLKDAGDIAPLDDGTYKLSLNDLKSGTLYYFTIKAATDDKLTGATYSGVLTTRGYPVQLTIEQNNLSIPGAKVKIGERTFVANKDAIVSTELADGDFTATITIPGDSTTHDAKLTVKKLPIPDSGNPTLQKFILNVATITQTSGSNSSPIPAIIGGGLAAVAVAGGGFGFLLFKKRKASAQAGVVDVDRDQLEASYGSKVESYMINTPEPNLDGNFVAPPNPPVNPTYAPEPQIQAAPISDMSAVDMSQQPMEQPVAEATAEAQMTQYDPATLPSDPTAPPPVQDLAMQQSELGAQAPETSQLEQAIQSYADQPTQASEPDTNEALSEELSKVESSEQIPDNNEPSAVYDSTTGELAIIHHHTATSLASAGSEPQPPIGNSTQQGAA